MYEIIELDNGLKIVMENLPYVKSATIGVWIGVGSFRETRSNNGISHFIEHMLFKGTAKRTAKEIAESIDDIGGHLNAFTSKDCTCYYCKVLSDHIDTAVDVLSDMLFNSLFLESDMTLEKGVVEEEINMYNDSPDELVHDLFTKNVWQGNSLSYPVLGQKKSLKKISRDDIIDYMKKYYSPKNSVISIVGNFDKDEIMSLFKNYFGNWKDEGIKIGGLRVPKFTEGNVQFEKEVEQTHLIIGYDGLPRGHKLLYPLMVVNTILGSGMSSKLFQKIREEKGLAYSIYSFQQAYSNAGLFSIYAGMKNSKLDETMKIIYEEIDILKRDLLTEKEINKSKEQLKGNVILGLEGTSSRMNAYGQSLLLIGKIRSLDETIAKIDAVNFDNVKEVIGKVFSNPSIAIIKKGN